MSLHPCIQPATTRVTGLGNPSKSALFGWTKDCEMPRYELKYPQDANNAIKRHGERGQVAKPLLSPPSAVLTGRFRQLRSGEDPQPHQRIANSPGLLQPPNSPFPAILPMIGQMGSFKRPSASLSDPLDLYLHGYVSARIFNAGRAAGSQGMPVCVAASHVDGLVLALSAFNHSYNYRSTVLFGHATLVEDKKEKLFAMELITDSVMPGRWENTRLPPTGAEMQSTSILRVKIASGSIKAREGDMFEDKHDLENKEAVDNIWTGVVPVYSAMGTPLPGAHNQAKLPSYATEFIDRFNEESKEESIAAAKKEQL